MPSTRPCWASDFPAPNQTASGPAIAKKPTVAMNVTKIELSATGTGTPARFMTHVDIAADPDRNGGRHAPRARRARHRPAGRADGQHRRVPAPGAVGGHRSIRLGEKLARLRHAVRRRATALHRVALDVR